MSVNLNGVFYFTRAEIGPMRERGGGSIVNMASILGAVGFANSVAYVAAKHGVVGLTQNAALNHAADEFRRSSSWGRHARRDGIPHNALRLAATLPAVRGLDLGTEAQSFLKASESAVMTVRAACGRSVPFHDLARATSCTGRRPRR